MRLVIACFVAVFAISFTSMAKENSNYHYCGIYVDTMCFGVARGDMLTMQIPVDYVLYEIQFHAGGNVQIYYGDNPMNVENALLVKRKGSVDIGEVSLYKIKEEDYRIIYRKQEDGRIKGWLEPIMDIHIEGVTEDNYKDYNDFLYNFTPCKMSDNKGVSCSDKSAFGSELFERDMFKKR